MARATGCSPMSRRKPPAVGDIVVALYGMDAEREVVGTVDWIGATMFAIQCEDERCLIDINNTEWRIVNE